MSEHLITSIRASTTKSGGKMWTCATLDGQRFNVFPDGRYLGLSLFGAYMDEIAALEQGQELRWTQHPIPVTLEPNGAYLNLVAVGTRPEGAAPDVPFVPDHVLARMAAQQWARTHQNGPVVVIDIETTGPDALNDEIVSISAIRLKDRRILLDQVIRPTHLQRLLDSGAGQINGFTPEQLSGAPSFAEVYADLSSVLDGRVWLAYNVAFDATVLERECQRHRVQPFTPFATTCAMEWYARFHGEWDSSRQQYTNKKLVDAAVALGIGAHQSHDALGDAGLTCEVIAAMAL